MGPVQIPRVSAVHQTIPPADEGILLVEQRHDVKWKQTRGCHRSSQQFKETLTLLTEWEIEARRANLVQDHQLISDKWRV